MKLKKILPKNYPENSRCQILYPPTCLQVRGSSKTDDNESRRSKEIKITKLGKELPEPLTNGNDLNRELFGTWEIPSVVMRVASLDIISSRW